MANKVGKWNRESTRCGGGKASGGGGEVETGGDERIDYHRSWFILEIKECYCYYAMLCYVMRDECIVVERRKKKMRCSINKESIKKIGYSRKHAQPSA
ncbi:hypothetical protein TSUD_290290 [Trifolium subterraneum]|uniref:Uncharacterized protein n=1 Tax=Trifolium subterraneum TaxID=3900 RepID=A0A2Z6N5Y6_TRISU|nr:hypothetical protein TSUD_290290 [Trifolium subterraneum]